MAPTSSRSKSFSGRFDRLFMIEVRTGQVTFDWAMHAFFDYPHTVVDAEIDAQGHVHNLRYLQWTLWAAGAHTRALGWDDQADLERGFGWVVREHEVTYRAAALAGDSLIIRTWVSDLAKFASRRRYVICRPADRAVLARVQTRWVYVDLNARKVVGIPRVAHEQLVVSIAPPPLPWESMQA